MTGGTRNPAEDNQPEQAGASPPPKTLYDALRPFIAEPQPGDEKDREEYLRGMSLRDREYAEHLAEQHERQVAEFLEFLQFEEELNQPHLTQSEVWNLFVEHLRQQEANASD